MTRITQVDFRTILIEKQSCSCRLRYNLYQEGEIRYPESISCREDTVVAYFLTSTIRDSIAETEHGFCVQRHWQIVPEGSFGLSFCLEFPADGDQVYMIPGVAIDKLESESALRAAGGASCCANGLYVFGDGKAMLMFTDPPQSADEAGSIEIQRLTGEEEGEIARAEIRIPSALAVSPGRDRRAAARSPRCFRSEGQFEYHLRLNVVTAGPGTIFRRGIEANLERNSQRLHRPAAGLSPGPNIEEQIGEICRGFLLQRGPVCGLLQARGSKRLSVASSCRLALIQLETLPKVGEAVELSRRLADFALKGQHPRGLFFPVYWTDRRSFVAADTPVAVALQESSEVAVLLLRIAGALRAMGKPLYSYQHAAAHMADSLLEGNQELSGLGGSLHPDSLLSAGPGAIAPSFVELILELQRITGKDRYRKALQTLASSLFGGQTQPLDLLGLEGNGGEVDPVLLLAQTALRLAGSGSRAKDLQGYFDALLARIHLNRPDVSSDFNPIGAVSQAPGDSVLLFRSFELAHTLLRLQARMPKAATLKHLHDLVRQLLAFSAQKPPGTPSFDPGAKGPERFAEPNSCVWTKELYFQLLLQREFPEVFT